MLLLSELLSADLVSFRGPVGCSHRHAGVFGHPTSTEDRRRKSVLERTSKMSLVSLIFLFVPGEWCVMHPLPCILR
jgi:hypothetical protein